MEIIDHPEYRKLKGNGDWSATITSLDWLNDDFTRFNIANLKKIDFVIREDNQLDMQALILQVRHPELVTEEDEGILYARYSISLNRIVYGDNNSMMIRGFLYKVEELDPREYIRRGYIEFDELNIPVLPVMVTLGRR
jgi:hypothetical protein